MAVIGCSFFPFQAGLPRSKFEAALNSRRTCNQCFRPCQINLCNCLPTISLKVGTGSATFSRRCVGLFTGSRSAGAAGRLPLLDVASHRLARWQQDALNVDGISCCLATFVDNLATIAETPEKAIRIMKDCEDELLRRWCLRIGPDSKEFMTCRVYPLPLSVPLGWEQYSEMFGTPS